MLTVVAALFFAMLQDFKEAARLSAEAKTLTVQGESTAGGGATTVSNTESGVCWVREPLTVVLNKIR
jgi:hypothetical protein